VTVLDALLRELVERDGSDLHLLDGVVPKARVHGELEPLADEPVDVEPLALPLMDARQRALFEGDGEVDLAHEVAGVGRFRVNVFCHHGGTGAVLRVIPHEIPTLENLRVPTEIERFTKLRQGLVLVTGPTGSGKSSTLAALLDVVNRTQSRHIVTIEDPIEFVHEDRMSTFTQREIGRDAATFEDALQSAARQDPNLILVGEMSDRATIQLALTLAEMGTVVFSTLHTNGAARTIDRIVEVFEEDQQPHVRSMLADSLQGVLSQILCPTADGEGRVPATELLFASTALRAVIRDGATHKVDSLFQSGRSRGMHRLDDDLFRLATEGIVAGEDAYRRANDKSRFDRFLPPPEPPS
jgi:twitching motility protein PilT